MGIRVSCTGTYCKEWFKEQIHDFSNEILITEDHAEVGDKIARVGPSAIFGTQMEQRIGKRLDIVASFLRRFIFKIFVWDVVLLWVMKVQIK